MVGCAKVISVAFIKAQNFGHHLALCRIHVSDGACGVACPHFSRRQALALLGMGAGSNKHVTFNNRARRYLRSNPNQAALLYCAVR